MGTATGDGTDTIFGVENVIGSAFDDRISTVAPGNGRIVFDRSLARLFEVLTVSPDGTDVRKVTDNRVDDYDGAWSPTGLRLAFASNRAGNYEL